MACAFKVELVVTARSWQIEDLVDKSTFSFDGQEARLRVTDADGKLVLDYDCQGLPYKLRMVCRNVGAEPGKTRRP